MVSKDFQLGAGHSLIKRIQNYENKVKYKVSIYLDWGGSWQFADALQIQVCVLRDLFRQVTRKAHTERLLVVTCLPFPACNTPRKLLSAASQEAHLWGDFRVNTLTIVKGVGSWTSPRADVPSPFWGPGPF